MRGEFFFSGKCNYKCFFCLQNEIGLIKESNDLARFDEWIALLHEKKVKVVTLSSFNCEPTIQPTFETVTQRLLDEGFELELRCNGAVPKKVMPLLAQFNIIWWSIQTLQSDRLKQIAKVSKVPDFKQLMIDLPRVEHRVSWLVNRYNADEYEAMFTYAGESNAHLMQVRKFYAELPEDTAQCQADIDSFQQVEDFVNTMPKVKGSPWLERWYGNTLKVSLWKDVIEQETGLKYFPSTQIITEVGRIIPMLQEEAK